MRNQLFTGLVLSLLLVGFLAGCAGPSLSVESAWGRPSPDGTGVIYLVIKNTGSSPDGLVSASSPSCGMTMIHETVQKADGTMAMNMITEPVVIPAGGQLEFKTGSYHIMCSMKKDDQWKTGSKIDLTLVFEKAGAKNVSVDIRDQ